VQRPQGPAFNLETQQESLPPTFEAIQHNLARSYVWAMAVLETGVEQKADVVCLQEAPREIAGRGISHSAYVIRKRKRVWTAVCKGCGLTMNTRTDLSKNIGDDVIVLDIKGTGEKIISIVNIYDQRARETGKRPARRLDRQKIIRRGGGGGMVLAGDFNANSQRWDRSCTERREVADWEEIIDERGLVIGNYDRPTHYLSRNATEGTSIMELTLANRSFGKWMILNGNHAMGSDHDIIEWEVHMEKEEEAGGTQVVGWNLAAMSQEDKEQAE